MKECDILGEGVKIYSDPSCIYSGWVRTPKSPRSTSLSVVYYWH